MNLEGKKVLAVGLARTGEAVAAFCKSRGAIVTVADSALESELGDRVAKMRDLGIPVKTGPHNQDDFTGVDLIVVSPGVPHAIKELEAARKKGIPVISEVELASRFIAAPIIAVTGTNGKTTVTTLIGEMLEASGIKAFVGGNIGKPLIQLPAGGESADVVVAEISSFQLDTIEHFEPYAAVLTNITEDHLNRYSGMEGYAASKARIFMNQIPDDFAVLNGSDSFTRSMEAQIKSRKVYFTGARENEFGARIDRNSIDFSLGEGASWSLSLEKTGLTGEHNKENIAASSLAAFAAGASYDGMQKALDGFSGLPHRLELIRELDGVRYYNDSKATNTDAVLRALEGFERPVVLIMGGRDKGSDWSCLGEMVKSRCAGLIVTGEASSAIADGLSDYATAGFASTVEEAVKMARQAASSGQVVLLSPGCASFDAYNNYKERGLDFSRAVKAL